MNEFELVGEARTETGKAATRRLRRSGLVPAILYGEGKDTVNFTLKRNEVKKRLENEAFASHVLTVQVGAEKSQAVLRAVQRDPRNSDVIHMDLLRISAKNKITMRVPLHFMNEEECPGNREGGVISHLAVEVEVSCLPKDLPEYIEVDMGEVELGSAIHLSELVMPEGVELVVLAQEGDHDPALVSVQLPKAAPEEEEEGVLEEGEEEEELLAGTEKPEPSDDEEAQS